MNGVVLHQVYDETVQRTVYRFQTPREALSFSALTLLFGRHEEHPARKN